MKRLLPLLLVILLLLGGCVTEDTVYEPIETVADGQTVVVQYDDGSTDDGTVTLESGEVYRFEKVSYRTMNYRFTYLGRLTGEVDEEGNPVLEPASPYEQTLAPKIRIEDLSRSVYTARPMSSVTQTVLFIVSGLLIIAGAGVFFLSRGFSTMFSAPKGLTSLAVKQLVQTEPSDRKTGSAFCKIVGAVIAACGVALLIFTLI